jgi:serine/threonine protein kinase
MKKIDLGLEHAEQNAQNEAKLLEKLDHPNIVKCYDTFLDDDHLCLILEYCEKGTPLGLEVLIFR